jgi:hypothetical protein
MTIIPQPAGHSAPLRHRDPGRWWARAFGGMFLAGAAAHIILVTARPSSYGSFADGSWWPFITHAWRSVLLPNVHYLIPLLVVFEAATVPRQLLPAQGRHLRRAWDLRLAARGAHPMADRKRKRPRQWSKPLPNRSQLRRKELA